MKGRVNMLLKNNSKEVENLVRYFETLDIKDKLKLNIVVLESDMIKLEINKDKLIKVLKNILCFFDKSYKKDVMIYYENHMDIFILAKVMEMKEKEREIFSFEILYAIHKIIKKI